MNCNNGRYDRALLYVFKLHSSYLTTSVLSSSTWMFNFSPFSLLTVLRCGSCSCFCTHFLDSVISILLYHHSVYHLTYSGAVSRSETQQLLSVLFKDETRHRNTTCTCIYCMHIRTKQAGIHTRTHINWHTYSGDESSDSCGSLKAIEFRISLVLKGQPGKVNLLLTAQK